MIEIIKRVEGERHKKETVRGEAVQVSYNDWGHLCVRVIQDIPTLPSVDSEGKCYEPARQADTLVVFDKATSERIIRFIKRSEFIPF